MKCYRCETAVPDAEVRNHKGAILCEDCYIETLCTAVPVCNPWQEYLSIRSPSNKDEHNIPELKTRKNCELLRHEAYQLGASDASTISPNQIEVCDELAAFCEKPKCEGFGASMSCPPHVAGPNWIRKRLDDCTGAIVYRITLPSDIMYSHQRIEIYRLLHEIGSSIEKKAKQMGYPNASAYAAGSCKKLFCSDYLDCNVLSGKGECRHPDVARPSMSGFGIDVKKLMAVAGWQSEESGMKPACGLVLIKTERNIPDAHKTGNRSV